MRLKTAIFFVLIAIQISLCAEKIIPSLELPQKGSYTFVEPTNRFTQFYNYESILQTLRSNGMTLEHRNFFEHIIPHEELGFFGYHSSTQGFRIFQDIIRIVLEEICEIPIKENFHFLRIPGNSLLSRQSASQFLHDYPIVNDQNEEQREQLLSANYALFGNFNQFGSCSVYYFTENRSASTTNFKRKLQGLFESIGMPVDALQALFAIGDSLRTYDAILLQLVDVSHYNTFHQPYELVDRMSYASHPLGVPDNRPIVLSKMYLGGASQPFTVQFRLVINNSDILNPFSSFRVKRYERNSLELVDQYEKELRKAIKALPYDHEKAKLFRQHLLKLWGQTDA